MRQREIDKINLEVTANWRARFDHVSAKVGTVPMLVWIPKDTVLDVGTVITFCEEINGEQKHGYILATEPCLFMER